jgi:hypothetical protein
LLFAFVIAALAAITSASFVLLLQAMAANHKQAMLRQHRVVAELAHQTGGVLTPRTVAEHFAMTYAEADRLLRSMVDDRYFKMKVDDREAELVFWFTELVEEPNASVPRGESKRRRQAERDSIRSRSA